MPLSSGPAILIWSPAETRARYAFVSTVALDDFGTGYSSLSYLHQFSLDYLKIDKSFVDDLNEDCNKVLILDAVVNLAKALKIKTTAEGIETVQQYQKLKEIGCDLGQGYYIAKPLLDNDFKGFLLNRTN